MQQLSALDSWFLHLESPRMPMHIGAINIFVPETEDQVFDFEVFKAFINERLHLSPVFRRRVVEVPMNLGRPFWVEDPNFNLDNQILHVALPQPANSMRDLSDFAAQFYNKQLDRTAPLWRMVFITGLDDIPNVPKNAFAVVAQIHHANIDGVSGAEIMATVFDMFPKPSKVMPPKKEWKAEALPSYTELIAKSYANTTETPAKLLGLMRNTGETLWKIAKENSIKMLPPPLTIMSAPNCIFNVPVTPNKVFGAVDLELKRIKKVKTALNVKVNDVVLAICSSALRKYLLEKDELPNKSLVAMAPISVRSAAEKSAMGNRISGMFVSLATDEEDNVDRLRKIYESTQSSKVYSKATPVDKLVELIPSEVGALAGRFYTQMGLSKLHRPFFNVIVTNVPGPPIPLYMNGFRLQNQYGLGLTFEGVGLMIVVFSYAGTLSICATTCEEIMPDVHDFAQYIREGLEDLEASVSEIQREEAYFAHLQEKYKEEV